MVARRGAAIRNCRSGSGVRGRLVSHEPFRTVRRLHNGPGSVAGHPADTGRPAERHSSLRPERRQRARPTSVAPAGQPLILVGGSDRRLAQLVEPPDQSRGRSRPMAVMHVARRRVDLAPRRRCATRWRRGRPRRRPAPISISMIAKLARPRPPPLASHAQPPVAASPDVPAVPVSLAPAVPVAVVVPPVPVSLAPAAPVVPVVPALPVVPVVPALPVVPVVPAIPVVPTVPASPDVPVVPAAPVVPAPAAPVVPAPAAPVLPAVPVVPVVPALPVEPALPVVRRAGRTGRPATPARACRAAAPGRTRRPGGARSRRSPSSRRARRSVVPPRAGRARRAELVRAEVGRRADERQAPRWCPCRSAGCPTSAA